MRWGPARQFARNTAAYSDHCSFPKETSALWSRHNGALPSLLLDLQNFAQLRNCWLDLLRIWWVKMMNVKEITLQQCSILILYDHYWKNNPGTLNIFCFKDEQRLIWKLTPPALTRTLSWNAPQKSMRQCLRNRLNKDQPLEEGKDAEKRVLCF